MEIKLSTVIMTIINFLILFFILKYFFWGKLKKVIDERQQDINNMLDSADEKLKEGEEFSRANKAILDGAKEEGKKITEARKQQADKIYADIVDSAKEAANTLRARAESEIEREKNKAETEIKDQVIELSLSVSQKALNKKIDEKEHRRLIDSFIDEVV